MKNLHIRAASAKDLQTIKELLVQAGLPVEDIDEARFPLFRLAEAGGECVGAIGMEAYGNLGLLRSLVVSPAARGQGLGKMLVDVLERDAIAAGVSNLWLLTIDVEDFFERLRFAIVARDAAPEQIRNTEEFSSLCPGNAHLMMKNVG